MSLLVRLDWQLSATTRCRLLIISLSCVSFFPIKERKKKSFFHQKWGHLWQITRKASQKISETNFWRIVFQLVFFGRCCQIRTKESESVETFSCFVHFAGNNIKDIINQESQLKGFRHRVLCSGFLFWRLNHYQQWHCRFGYFNELILFF